MRVLDLSLCGLALITSAVAATPLSAIEPVPHVDLSRFMGKWYVVAAIPTRYEKNAYNAIETYTLQPDGTIRTSLSFHEGGFNGPSKRTHATAYVRDGTGNGVWGVRVFGPIKLQYIVAYLNTDYSEAIVARDKRDYVWVIARTPNISQSDYKKIATRVAQLGYDDSKLRKMPQAAL